MKAVVFGAGGFVGGNVAEQLRGLGHEVEGTYHSNPPEGGRMLDMADEQAVGALLADVRPDIVVQCAGVVRNDASAEANVAFTGNVLSQIISQRLPLRQIVILGSAAEYGLVAGSAGSNTISEDTSLAATSPYGTSKVREVALALRLRNEAHLPVSVARIFNPIGPGMPAQQLVPRLLAQIEQFKQGERTGLEISRADSRRDFVDIRDVAGAIALLATSDTKQPVYNIGSGISTSNGELVELLVGASSLSVVPPVAETAALPEDRVADRADISRLGIELGWRPAIPLRQTVKDIVDAAKNQISSN